jgi:aerobic-type carbon monoxide dehydrogenase small subunit (CoxS/CutS family)
MEDVLFKINGREVKLRVEGDRTLLWVLRSDLGITGVKYGCGQGLCGACTVLVNNEAVLSCQTVIGEVNGAEIVTIEGLAGNGKLHPVQKAFIRHDALQCGFCTPGMILRACSLLEKNNRPTRDEIIREMDQNLCRCGSYKRIIRAIEEAAREMRGETRI